MNTGCLFVSLVLWSWFNGLLRFDILVLHTFVKFTATKQFVFCYAWNIVLILISVAIIDFYSRIDSSYIDFVCYKLINSQVSSMRFSVSLGVLCMNSRVVCGYENFIFPFSVCMLVPAGRASVQCLTGSRRARTSLSFSPSESWGESSNFAIKCKVSGKDCFLFNLNFVRIRKSPAGLAYWEFLMEDC